MRIGTAAQEKTKSACAAQSVATLKELLRFDHLDHGSKKVPFTVFAQELAAIPRNGDRWVSTSVPVMPDHSRQVESEVLSKIRASLFPCLLKKGFVRRRCFIEVRSHGMMYGST